MVTELQYTSIKRVLDNLLDHPMLSDVSLEQAIRHTIRFISLHGYSKMYQDKIDDVEIKDFRGTLPCDLISIIQVKDLESGTCLRSMTDDFTPGLAPHPKPPKHPKDLLNNAREDRIKKGIAPFDHFLDKPGPWYIPPLHRYMEEPAFKTQGRIIFTSFPHGMVQVAYKSIPVDENGFPLLIDNETYLNALEAYIKMKVFEVKFDQGKINVSVFQNAQQSYALAAKNLQTEFTTPSYSEAESMSRYFQSLIPRMREFDKGFKHMGDREYLRRH